MTPVPRTLTASESHKTKNDTIDCPPANARDRGQNFFCFEGKKIFDYCDIRVTIAHSPMRA